MRRSTEAHDGATHTYDPVGNRTSKTNLLHNFHPPHERTSNYTYDALYQLNQVVQGANVK